MKLIQKPNLAIGILSIITASRLSLTKMKINKYSSICLAYVAFAAITTTAMADSWKIDPRCFLNGPSGSFDSVAVKDASIVNSGGYQLFYTSRSSSAWGLGYASASSITGLKTATHHHLTSIGSGGGLAAPQIFYFGVKGKWFLLYQNGTTPSYSTSTSVSGYSSWTAARSMGFSDGGIDYRCISDGTTVYLFYSANNGSHQILRRSTSVANFPTGWSSASVATTGGLESPSPYNLNGTYYMMVETLGRYFQLWKASSPGGTWTLQQEHWADAANCTFTGENWTTQIGHGDILRSGTSEKMTISSITSPQILIQGVKGYSGSYSSTPYDLGLIHK